jgi:hypothetical protein
VSGNPSGRPKSQNDFEAACRARAPEALERLAQIMRGRGAAAVRACELILAYSYGKPVASLNVTAKAAPLDDARFRGAARAALEAAVIEAEASIVPPTRPAELPALTNEEVALMPVPNQQSGTDRLDTVERPSSSAGLASLVGAGTESRCHGVAAGAAEGVTS